jgi:hypothetical protein
MLILFIFLIRCLCNCSIYVWDEPVMWPRCRYLPRCCACLSVFVCLCLSLSVYCQ